MNENSQSVKYANITIPAKVPPYLRRILADMSNDPLQFVHAVIATFLLEYKTWRPTGQHCSCRVRRREMAPSLAAV